jgi:hypothetical protein
MEQPSMKKQTSSVTDQINKYNIHLGTKDSIMIFKKLKVVENARKVHELIQKHLSSLPETFIVQIFEPLLMFKLSIDINFLGISPSIYESLGFDMQELVEYLFIFDDNKLLMFYDDKTIFDKDLEELCGLGILKIEYIQQANDLVQNRYQSYLELLHQSFFKKKASGVSASEEFKIIEDDDLLASKSTLLEMGFNPEESEKALKKSRFSVQNAMNYLLGKKKNKDKKEKEIEIDDDVLDADPKQMLFSDVTGKDLKDNSVLNYYRYIIYSLDSILDYCCI